MCEMGSVHTDGFSSNARLPSVLHARYRLNFSAPDLGIHLRETGRTYRKLSASIT